MTEFEMEEIVAEIDDLANGPYYPEDVVKERLRALLEGVRTTHIFGGG